MDKELRNELSEEQQEPVEKIENALKGVAEIEDWEFEDQALRLSTDSNLTLNIDFENKNLYLYSEDNYGASAPQGETVEEVANWFRMYADQMEKEHKKMLDLGFSPEKVEHEDVSDIFCLYSKAYPLDQLDDLAKDLEKLNQLWDETENEWKKLYPGNQYGKDEKEHKYEDEENLEELVEQLENEDKQTRVNAVIALGDYACDGLTIKTALPKLEKLLDDPDEETRMNAAYALGDYASEGLTVETIPPKLIKLLEEENEKVPGAAAYALATYASKGLTNRTALPKLKELLKKGKNEETRDYAAYALDEYDERGLKPP
jgi:hypothetical protein